MVGQLRGRNFWEKFHGAGGVCRFQSEMNKGILAVEVDCRPLPTPREGDAFWGEHGPSQKGLRDLKIFMTTSICQLQISLLSFEFIHSLVFSSICLTTVKDPSKSSHGADLTGFLCPFVHLRKGTQVLLRGVQGPGL